MRKKLRIPVVAAVLAAFFLPNAVQALTLADFTTVSDPSIAHFFEFCVIEGEGLPNAPESDLNQLDLGLAVTVFNDLMLFEFVNRSSTASAVADIYFDDSGEDLIGNGSVFATLGTVNFAVGPGAPGNLPAGNNLNPGFEANTALSAHAANPVPSRGINPGENLVLAYDYLVAPELIGAALLDDTLRIGIHLQSIGLSGESDAFIVKPYEMTPNPQDPIPEPATLVLLGMGSGFLALRRRIRA